jgi:hypothetical protein
VIGRTAAAVGAIIVVALLGASLRSHNQCEDARRTVFAVTLGRQPISAQADAINNVREHCRGTTALLAVAGALHRQGRDAQALPLAREAVREEPDNAAAWSALGTVAASSAEALAAERRLAVLDPLRGSLNRSSGRSTR